MSLNVSLLRPPPLPRAQAFPQSARAWYAVACYYHVTRRFELARRFFLKVWRFAKTRCDIIS